ncbi:hypothetical protein RJ641_030355, partial [Dillenia turbinata]
NGFYTSSPLHFPSPTSNLPSSTTLPLEASSKKKKVLIVSTNSGGHAVIGFCFAKELLVTIFTVEDEGSDKMKKPPFNRFSEIVCAGGKTVWGDPSEVGKVVGGTEFDVVLDNNGKDLDTMKTGLKIPVSDNLYASAVLESIGLLKSLLMLKGDASHDGVESCIQKIFCGWAIFRPQYMICSGDNKDCEEWFFDRIVRDRPVPIPGSGMQLTLPM